MQLTKNVSLFRLLTKTLDEVVTTHGEYDALDIVGYEILPHLNRFEPSFVETIRQYSERVPHDIIALADGAAAIYTDSNDYRCTGNVLRFRNGAMKPIEATD
jgi:peptidase E